MYSNQIFLKLNTLLIHGYFDAIKSHKQQKLKLILMLRPSLIKSKNHLGLTGLMQAVASRNYDAIDYLLNKGIDTGVMDHDGWTAKTWAIFMNDHKALKSFAQMCVITDSKQYDANGMVMIGFWTILAANLKRPLMY